MPNEGKAYIHAALALHYAGQPVTEEALEKIVRAMGLEPNAVKIKMLVASLSQINLEDVLKQALVATPVATVSAPAAQQVSAPTTQQTEEKKEEKKEEEVDLYSGLSGLFGI
ncbi:MAG: 50S ribosomal protein L12 [Acidilobaceae archaeon]